MTFFRAYRKGLDVRNQMSKSFRKWWTGSLLHWVGAGVQGWEAEGGLAGKMEQQLWETSQSCQATGWCHRAARCSLWADLAFHLFGNALKLEKEFTSSKSVKTSKEQFVICGNYAQFKFRFHKVLIFMMKNFVKSFLSLLLHNYVHYVFKFSSWCQKL